MPMIISSLTLEEQKHYYNKVKELLASDGWVILKRVIETERGLGYRLGAP